MRVEVFPDESATANAAAAEIAVEARLAIAERGRFVCALSGGRTPWKMLRILSKEELPWNEITFVQVDERLAPDGDPDRNLTHIYENLPHVPRDRIIAMPVTAAIPGQAAANYERTLHNLCGTSPAIDLVCLGLGPDGHTASLIPGDPVLDITEADVAVTGVYQGRRRMTLTYRALDHARRILWLITGAEKKTPLARLLAADRSIPAGRVSQTQATVFADAEAASE